MMTTDHANIGLDTVFVQLCAILAEIVKQFFFNNGGTNLHKNYTWAILLTC